jgi:hypothetical protein
MRFALLILLAFASAACAGEFPYGTNNTEAAKAAEEFVPIGASPEVAHAKLTGLGFRRVATKESKEDVFVTYVIKFGIVGKRERRIDLTFREGLLKHIRPGSPSRKGWRDHASRFKASATVRFRQE